MQRVRYTYSSGCSACESHDLKIWKTSSKNIFVINSYNSSWIVWLVSIQAQEQLQLKPFMGGLVPAEGCL